VTDKLANLRTREGLPEDACVLIPINDADQIPMRNPEGASAMLVVAIDMGYGMTTLPVAITDGTDRTDKVPAVALFAGCWQPDQPPANHHDGDVLIRLTEPTWREGDRVDVQMFLLYQHRWQIVGTWNDVGTDWPYIVAPTASAVMELHTNACESARPVAQVDLRTDRL
jgi:hypothetical protein